MHARVEDAIRTGKDTGIGKFPSHLLSLNRAWFTASLTAATLLAWLRLLALDGDLARAEPKTLRYKILHAAARLVRTSRRRRLKISATWPWAPAIVTAWQRISALAQAPLTSTKPSPRPRKAPRGPWNPRPPGPPAGPLSHPDPKIKIHYVTWRHSQASDRSA